MLRASLYITVCTARNRARVRLRRLREPRYLLGAIAGIAYLYVTVFARMRGARAGRQRGNRTGPARATATFAALQTAGSGIAAMVLLVLAALGWVFPTESGLLDFTPAEVDILMSAPVTRRQLLMHRLLRSQIGVLFASIVPALVFPSASGFSRVRVAVGLWFLFVTSRVYFTGVTLARTRLGREGGPSRLVAWTPLAVLLGAMAIVTISLLRAFAGHPVTGPDEFFMRLGAVSTSGAAHVVLLPLLALVGPLFAPWPWAFLAALVPAAIVLALTTAWVLHSDEAFEEATAAVAARKAAAAKSRTHAIPKARASGWRVPSAGPAEGVFLWKNAMQILRATTGASLVRYFVPLAVIAVTLSTMLMSATNARGAAMTLCTLALGAAVFTLLLGPQVVRVDLREDLRHLELLKTWPVKPATVVRGEMLCPGALLTVIAWLAITCAAILSSAGFPGVSLTWRLSAVAAALVLAPAFVFAQLTVHNAAAVLFPAWVPLGHQRPRGVDALGQRLILFGAVLLTLVGMIAPGLLAGAILWIAFFRFVGPLVLIPGALVCLAIVTVEVLAATEALGPAYERLDILAVERSE
jgi:hypothetical protein